MSMDQLHTDVGECGAALAGEVLPAAGWVALPGTQRVAAEGVV